MTAPSRRELRIQSTRRDALTLGLFVLGKLQGRLKISGEEIIWRPRNSRSERAIGWDEFEEFIKGQGVAKAVPAKARGKKDSGRVVGKRLLPQGPILAEVPCCGSTHRLRWTKDAGLCLLDHELEEDVLIAFGGKPPPCLRARQSWDAGNLRRQSHRVYQHDPLPEPLRRVRALTKTNDARALLRREIRQSVLRVSRRRVRLEDIDVSVVASDAGRWAKAWVVGGVARVSVGVPVEWLRDVWLFGQDIDAGRLVLDVEEGGSLFAVDLLAGLPKRRSG